MKPSKDCKRMWYIGNAFYVGSPIDCVPVRECEQKYAMRRIEYFNGSFWVDSLADLFFETKEAALSAFHASRKKRIAKLKREISSLEKAAPKWREGK